MYRFMYRFMYRWNSVLSRGLTIILLLGLALLSISCGKSLTDAQHVERAREFQEKGQLRTSVIELKNALQKNPANREARLLLGQIYVEVGDGASAEKELRSALDQGIAIESLSVPLAQSLLLQGKFADLLALNVNTSQLNDDTKATLFALRGRAYLDQGKVNEAAEQFQLALKAKPDSPATLLGQALLAFEKGQWDEARRWNDKVLAIAPTFVEAHALQGDLALVKNNFTEAESEYQQAVKAKPTYLSYRVGLAIAQINTGKLDPAISQLNSILKVAPNYPFGNYLRALAAYQKKDFKEAQLYAKKALDIETDDPRSRLIAGTASYYLGEFQQANEHLTRFVAQAPNYAPALQLLAATQAQLGFVEKAAATLKPVEVRSENDARLLAIVGQAALRGGDLRLGRELFEKAVKAQPDQAATRVQLGATKLASGEQEQGIEELQRALELDPKSVAGGVLLTLTYLRKGEYDKALETARQLQENQPANPVGFTLAGIAYGAKGDEAAAKAAFNKALEIKPGDTNASINLAAYALRDKDWNKARDLYEKVLVHNPGHLKTMLKLVELESRSGHPQQAEAKLEEALNKNPDSLEACVWAGNFYLAFDQPGKVLRLTEPFLQRYPNAPGLLEVVGKAQMRMGQPSNAVTTFQALVKAQPTSANAHFLLAQAYSGVNDGENLHKELDKALELDPNHLLARVAQGQWLMLNNKPKEANKMLEQLKKTYPENPEVIALAGDLAMAQNRPQEAVAAFQEGLKKSPDNRAFTLKLAQAQSLAGDVAGGQATLKDWLEKHPTDMGVQYTLANNYLLQNRLEDAKAAFAKVVMEQPDNAPALNNLAWLLRQEDPAKAQQYAERALKVAPNWPPAMDTLGMLLLDQGQTERPLRLFKEASEKAPDDLDIHYHLALALARGGDKAEAGKILKELLAKQKPFENKQAAESLLNSLGD